MLCCFWFAHLAWGLQGQGPARGTSSGHFASSWSPQQSLYDGQPLFGGTHQALEPVSQLFANVKSLSLSIHASICPPSLWGRGLVLAAGPRDVVWGDSGMEKAVGSGVCLEAWVQLGQRETKAQGGVGHDPWARGRIQSVTCSEASV